MIIALQTLVFFRESLLAVLGRVFERYYKNFSLLSFKKIGNESEDEDDEQVFADFDDEKGVVFFPPMYAQRYAAVSDCLMDERWCGALQKVVDLGYHDISFIKYLKEVPGIKNILGVDLECIPLTCSSDLLGSKDYMMPKRDDPVQITLFQGNAADPDYRLIGCDAVIAIEMIEHMLPHDLERLVHTVFGFIKPWMAVFTTPNGDFNVLFKALEINGYRRLDHLFEWSREQFHDWCSNIVARYPEYSVTCKGIGPGPPGTQHLGCCSQMALFTNKNYHKQPDLNLNSLALVSDAPDPDEQYLSDIIADSMEDDNSALPIKEDESNTQLIHSARQSCVTLVLESIYSCETLEYSDKISQCDLDLEISRSFLMFDNEINCKVIIPRKKVDNKVYEIEDVTSRLNCSTLQVTKFSKTTQNLMARNKIDSLVYTRQVVDEIRQLTKMLNFDKKKISEEKEDLSYTWNNINWGENAPYWNQYYKVIKHYTYPFETKTEESRILDLISDEINHIIDFQYGDEFSAELNRIEIPLDHLMRIVDHITSDVEKVKDLLEWNGYEIMDNLLIHSRQVLEEGSNISQNDEWKDNETPTDWDLTDHTTSFSDASTLLPDYHGRCLRRALDRKVKKLRSMLNADEDITTELDKVICRLMKWALRLTKGHQNPPPARWIQCKLFDILTLTEKTIEMRKRHFIESYPLNAICYDQEQDKSKEQIALDKIKDDKTAIQIMDKYDYLIDPDKEQRILLDLEFEDDFTMFSNPTDYYKEYDFIDKINFPPGHVQQDLRTKILFHDNNLNNINNESQLDRTKAWVEEDFVPVEPDPYPLYELGFNNLGALNSPFANTLDNKQQTKHKIIRKEPVNVISCEDTKEIKKNITKNSESKVKARKEENRKIKRGGKTNLKVKIFTNVVKKKSSYNFNNKHSYKDIAPENKKSVRKCKDHKYLQSKSSQPIPESIIKLCQEHKNVFELSDAHTRKYENDKVVIPIAATKESLLIDIVTCDTNETIALRRTIGTDADVDPTMLEPETVLERIINVTTDDSFYKAKNSNENVKSQTIFLYDINEPSTSKGYRHENMDVQCGPDSTLYANSMMSVSTSLTKMPEYCTAIKIEKSVPNINKIISDYGTSRNDSDNNVKILYPRIKSFGIIIKDSDLKFNVMSECATMTTEVITEKSLNANISVHEPRDESNIIKPISNDKLNSCSDLCSSLNSFIKSPLTFASSPRKLSINKIELCNSRDIGITQNYSPLNSNPSKLVCGGYHIHSYKDRQITEDVVFQGEWQERKSKTLTKKVRCGPQLRKPVENGVLSKRNKSKDKLLLPKSMQAKMEPKQNKNILLCTKVKQTQEANTRLQQRQKLTPSSRALKSIRSNKKIIKINSRNKINAVSTKNMKTNESNKKVSFIDSKNEANLLKKSYLPPYLEKILGRSILSKNVNSLNPSEKNKIYTCKNIKNFKNKEDEIKKDLLKISCHTRINTNYSVFRNEVENESCSKEVDSAKNRLEKTVKNDALNKQQACSQTNVNNSCNEVKNIAKTASNSSHKTKDEINELSMVNKTRNSSPISLNSLDYSSPNSVETVKIINTKIKSLPKKRTSTTSNNDETDSASRPTSTNATQSNVTSTQRNKRYTRKTKKYIDIDDDKENKELQSTVKDISSKAATHGKNNSIYVAQIQTETTLAPVSTSCKSTNPINKTEIKNYDKENVVCVSSGPDEPPIVDQLVIDKSLAQRKESQQENCTSEIPTSIVTPQSSKSFIDDTVVIKVVESKFLSELIESSNKILVGGHMSNIDTMRQLVEESLDFIDSQGDTTEDNDNFDSQTVVLSRGSIINPNFFDDGPSRISYKTLFGSDELFDSVLEIDFENALKRNFDTISGDESIISLPGSTRMSLKDSDFLSLKSINFGNENNASVIKTSDEMDLNVNGMLAIQELNRLPEVSEHVNNLDPINSVDSETGSRSDVLGPSELYATGRSSDSYESCQMDDGSIVPNWLFRIISQQESIDEEESPEMMMPMPMEIPMPYEQDDYDVNGNVMEPNITAGAGDARGIHSDSRDSSGRGSSLSSTDSSSGQQSETLLIDPFAVGQYQAVHDSFGSLAVVAIPINYNGNLPGDNPTSTHEERPLLTRYAAASDADVSSLDTDVPDSDI